jgi:hypothetical protein
LFDRPWCSYLDPADAAGGNGRRRGGILPVGALEESENIRIVDQELFPIFRAGIAPVRIQLRKAYSEIL